MDHERLRALFDELVEYSPAVRALRLSEIREEDPALEQAVAALLGQDGDAVVLLEAVRAAAAGVAARAEAPLTHIGPYRLLHVLGHGGMGTVYLAERADIDKKVALKLVEGASFRPHLRTRLLHERRILARLEHPRIARLLDAGIADTGPGSLDGGIPYFVMEYVEGEPLTAYAERQALNLTARLRLFLQVVDAVRYAHRNLVVHRDLKPSNILVAENENETPEIKLLDFGIAKLIQVGDTGDEGPELTQTGMRVMTPQYAAPEQVRGQAVTPATDVYALGILLYELLTGRLPYRIDGLSPAEVERVVCASEPIRPSVQAARPLQAHRSTLTPESRRLRRQLRGDLDAIVMTALSKEPERRYASAEGLAHDLIRYLEGKPVQARAETLFYRTGKFVRRHRWSVAASAVIIVLLVGYAATLTIQARRILWERDRAEQALARSEAVKGYLIDLFEESSPKEAPGDTITAHDLLRRGVDRARTLEAQPDVQAEMLDAMGEAHMRLGWLEEAERLHRQALARRRSHYGDASEPVAESLDHLAWVLLQRGRYPDGERLAREALAIRQQMPGASPLKIAHTLYVLASNITSQGRHSHAEQMYRQALALRLQHQGENHADVASARFILALALWRLDRLDEADLLARQAYAVQRTQLGERHPDLASTLELIGNILIAKGNYTDAEQVLRQSLEQNRLLFGNHHWRVAQAIRRVATAVSGQGNHAGAEQLYRQALDIYVETLGPEHPAVAAILSPLAQEVNALDQPDEAEALQKRSSYIRHKTLGATHPATLKADLDLAAMLAEHNHLTDADSTYRILLAIAHDDLASDDPYRAAIPAAYADLHLRRGDYAAASVLYQESLRFYQQALGPDHRDTRAILEKLAALYQRQGQADSARSYLAQLRSPTSAPAHPESSTQAAVSRRDLSSEGLP